MKLRSYQCDSIVAVKRELERLRSTLLLLPTGAGKTVIVATLGSEWNDGRVLVLAHTEELINQAAATIKRVTGQSPDIEQADRRALPQIWGGSKIVVGSIASVYRENRLNGEVLGNPNDFGLLVIDEGHRAVRKNRMYRKVIEHYFQNPKCKLLLVTATADRTDGKGLAYAESVAYDVKLSWMIDQGWLVPIRQEYGICTSIDFRRVRITAGEFNDADQERVMLEEKPLHEVAGAILEKCKGKKTLVFAAGIHHAERLSEILRERHGLRYVCVHGGNHDYPMDPEKRRRRILECRNGEHEGLVGCDVFYEGFDWPQCEVVVIAKKTKSRLRYTQACGRGTRIHPDVILDPDSAELRRAAIAASAKPYMTVIDLVGASTRLELELPCVADLLIDQPWAKKAAIERAKKKAIEAGGSADMRDDVLQASLEIEREEEEKKRRAAVVAETKFEWQKVTGVGKNEVGSDGMASGQPATQSQLDFLNRHGIDGTGMTKRQAGREMDRLFKSFKGQVPTPKQEEFLKKRGMDGRAKNKDHASALIDLTIANGWRPPTFALTKDRLVIRPVDGKFRAVIKMPGREHVMEREFDSVESVRSFFGRIVESQEPVTV